MRNFNEDLRMTKLSKEHIAKMQAGRKKIKPVSLRKAVNEMCKQCIYDKIGGDGTWRQQTAACTDKTCALYSVRPLSDGAEIIVSSLDSCITNAVNKQ